MLWKKTGSISNILERRLLSWQASPNCPNAMCCRTLTRTSSKCLSPTTIQCVCACVCKCVFRCTCGLQSRPKRQEQSEQRTMWSDRWTAVRANPVECGWYRKRFVNVCVLSLLLGSVASRCPVWKPSNTHVHASESDKSMDSSFFLILPQSFEIIFPAIPTCTKGSTTSVATRIPSLTFSTLPFVFDLMLRRFLCEPSRFQQTLSQRLPLQILQCSESGCPHCGLFACSFLQCQLCSSGSCFFCGSLCRCPECNGTRCDWESHIEHTETKFTTFVIRIDSFGKVVSGRNLLCWREQAVRWWELMVEKETRRRRLLTQHLLPVPHHYMLRRGSEDEKKRNHSAQASRGQDMPRRHARSSRECQYALFDRALSWKPGRRDERHWHQSRLDSTLREKSVLSRRKHCALDVVTDVATVVDAVLWTSSLVFLSKRGLTFRIEVFQKNTTSTRVAVEYTFIQNRFHPLTLSSKHDFIQWHFHPKHFHPILTLSSNDTFIQNIFIQQQFHPMNFSSHDIFIQWHFHLMTFSTNDGFLQNITCGTINIVRVCVKASQAEGRRRLHTNTAYARLSGFNRPSPEGLLHRSNPKGGSLGV